MATGDDILTFNLSSELSAEEKAQVSELNEALAELGIIFKEFQYEAKTSDKTVFHYISITYSSDYIKYKLKRNAGRVQTTIDLSPKEIRERMAKGETAEDIASELNISRSTLFRRLKEADK